MSLVDAREQLEILIPHFACNLLVSTPTRLYTVKRFSQRYVDNLVSDDQALFTSFPKESPQTLRYAPMHVGQPWVNLGEETSRNLGNEVNTNI